MTPREKEIKIAFIFMLLVGLAFFIMVKPVHAQVQTLGNFKINECIRLIQIMANGTSCNITSVTMPNSTVVLQGSQLTKSGSEYSTTYCNISSISGEWIVNGICNPNGLSTIFSYDYYVNQLTTSQSIIYFISLIIAVFLFIMSLYFAITIPSGNLFDGDGKLISIGKLKYLKIALIPVTYMILVFIVGIVRSITSNFLFTMNGISNMFEWIYWILMSLIYPAIVLTFVFIIVFVIQDKFQEKKMKRGGHYR